MSDFQDIIHCITDEPSTADPAVAIPARVNSMLSELDDMMVMAAKPDTQDAVAGERIAFEQMMVRCQLILSFIEVRRPSLRVIGGSR